MNIGPGIKPKRESQRLVLTYMYKYNTVAVCTNYSPSEESLSFCYYVGITRLWTSRDWYINWRRLITKTAGLVFWVFLAQVNLVSWLDSIIREKEAQTSIVVNVIVINVFFH